jgi:tRNA(adenine34) deaminase
LHFSNTELMEQAIHAARQSRGEVPVGALLLSPSGEIIASAVNNRESSKDPTGHAEIIALREGGRIMGDWRLEGCTLVVTLEPCVMCAGAISEARIGKVIFGAFDEKHGAAGSSYDILRDPNNGFVTEVIGGVLHESCSELLSDFFGDQRG